MKPPPPAPADRLHPLNQRPAPSSPRHVLYWMVAARRTRHNFGLQHALARAGELGLPLIVLEPLRIGYRWASDRLHHFVIDGMHDNADAFADTPVAYHPYVEPQAGAGKGLLAALAQDAALVVTDLYPCFFLPRMQARAAALLDVPLVAVDSLGILPLSASDRVFTTAASFRRHVQKTVAPHLRRFPRPVPLDGVDLPPARIPDAVQQRWPAADQRRLARDRDLSDLAIDHHVTRAPVSGGEGTARAVLDSFVTRRLAAYGDDRNHPDRDAASGLSPYLHFGHVSVHEVMRDLFERESWSPDKAAPKANGARHGWWGMSQTAEAFVDEIVTWREIGHVFCHHRPDDYDQLSSLPEWAQKTMHQHRDDRRPHVYTLAEFEAAATHDDLWNAAQRELVDTGRMQNYLRMLWGKKIYHWTRTPEDALAVMIELNNKYALDGRDPNSYSGIFWTLGRFDRAWGPEREVFGKLRYMTSDSTRRKLKLDRYLQEHGAGGQAALL